MNTTDPDPQPTEKSCKLYRTDKNLIFQNGIVGMHQGTYSGEMGPHYRIVSEDQIPLSTSWGYLLATTDHPQGREVELSGEELGTIDGVPLYSYKFRFIK